MTWKEALQRIMLRYSALTIRKINDCLRGDEDDFRVQAAARECWHYGLLHQDGYIEKRNGSRYTGEVVYLERS